MNKKVELAGWFVLFMVGLTFLFLCMSLDVMIVGVMLKGLFGFISIPLTVFGGTMFIVKLDDHIHWSDKINLRISRKQGTVIIFVVILFMSICLVSAIFTLLDSMESMNKLFETVRSYVALHGG